MKVCARLFCVFMLMFVIGCDGGGSSNGDSSNGGSSNGDDSNNSNLSVDAGEDQIVAVNSCVQLDGEFDQDEEYSWSFISTPDNSVVLSDYFIANPTFEAKIRGEYILSLMVNNNPACVDEVSIRVCTEIERIIDEDTILYLNDSPYIITDKVQIAHDTTLQINAGVEIVKGYHYQSYGFYDALPGMIEVFGTLNVYGTENNETTFYNTSIKQTDAHNKISKVNLNHVKMTSGTLRFEGANFSLKNSILIDMGGMYLYNPSEDCFIEKNIFTNCGRIYAATIGAHDVYITQNVFHNYHHCAIKNAGSPGEVIVEFNSFLDTNKFAVYLDPYGYDTNIIAENNYWGTTDESVIETMIYDRNDDLNCENYVSYLPFLTEPDPGVPDITPYLEE